MLAIQGVYDGVSIKPKEAIPFNEEYEVVITFLKPKVQKIVEKKQESVPNAETVEAFKWTENYLKSGKKKGFKTTKELYKSWGLNA
jgi:hypothetical protein